MASSQQLYDNPFTRYKKELWELCVSMNVFDNIPETNLEKTKSVFENIVTNYQTHILQQDDDKFLKQKIVTEINQEVSKLKEITRDALMESKKNQFDLQLEEKQKEFNNMMQQNIPETPQFQDNQEDEPLEKENLDALIQQQMKERENVMNMNQDVQNKVVSDNMFSEKVAPIASTPITQPTSVVDPMSIHNINQLEQRLNIIEKNITLQSNILRQIVESQIAILNKLK